MAGDINLGMAILGEGLTIMETMSSAVKGVCDAAIAGAESMIGAHETTIRLLRDQQERFRQLSKAIDNPVGEYGERLKAVDLALRLSASTDA